MYVINMQGHFLYTVREDAYNYYGNLVICSVNNNWTVGEVRWLKSRVILEIKDDNFN